MAVCSDGATPGTATSGATLLARNPIRFFSALSSGVMNAPTLSLSSQLIFLRSSIWYSTETVCRTGRPRERYSATSSPVSGMVPLVSKTFALYRAFTPMVAVAPASRTCSEATFVGLSMNPF